MPILPGRAPLPIITLEKKLKGHIEGAFLSKTQDSLTLSATYFENRNQLKAGR